LGTRDGLTGAFNRRKFDEDLEAEIARSVRYSNPLSLVMVDIDYFKAYNDVHGHPMGDSLLKRLVTVLSSNLRPFDKVYRYGGEEFAVLLPETGKEKALLATQRLMDVIRQEQFEGEKESQPNAKLTVSMGLAGFPEDGNTKDLLLKRADMALYQAKSDGRDRIRVYNA
jgi:diguanylate cyclase (GGDEF)-like protein